jgi:hypothetical protein
MSAHNGIDILKLYSSGNSTAWNAMLTDCVSKLDINRLIKIKYELSVGMSDLAKKKMNNENINVQFLRWMRSIEITAKRIIKIRNPMPGDNVIVIKGEINHDEYKLRALTAKRNRDKELQDFIKRSAY